MAITQGKWLQVNQKEGGPKARSSHAVAVVGKKAYVFGGEVEPRVPVDNLMHILDLEDNSWSVAEAKGEAPPPRVGVTMVPIGSVIYLFGGRDQHHKELNHFYSFDTNSCQWNLISEADGPPHRTHGMMMTEDAEWACQLVPISCDICLALSLLNSIRRSNGREGLGFNPLTTLLRLELGGVIVVVSPRFLVALQWSGLVKVSGWKLIFLRFALVTMISPAKAWNLDNLTSCGFMCLHFLSSSSALELHLVSTLKGYRLCPGWFNGLPKMRKRLYFDNPF